MSNKNKPRRTSSSVVDDYGKDNHNCDHNAGDVGIVSAQHRFKEIPIHPSILQYIRRVGVGREGKENRRKKRPFENKKRRNNKKKGNTKRFCNSPQQQLKYGDADTMSREEERQFLANGRVARHSGTSNPAVSNAYQRWERRQQSPPPPFGEGKRQKQKQQGKPVALPPDRESYKVIHIPTATEETMATKQKARNIRVLPVKVLGRVGFSSSSSSDDSDVASDEFPRPTSGLPEVAIIGRSNVGKSTLLNALLYSGRTTSEKEESEDFVRRQHRRRRSPNIVTSQTAKLPKGLKAKTSSKPGETRSIDFYQLSAEIEELDVHEGDEKNTDNQSGLTNNDKNIVRKKKTSLVLVDLPGYGFAFGPKKDRKQIMVDDTSSTNNDDNTSMTDFLFPWQSLIEIYITYRPRSSLKRVLLLIDARHGVKQADSHFLASLQRALLKRQRMATSRNSNEQQQRIPTELPPLQIVLTKCDLVSQVDLARRVVEVRQQLSDSLIRQPKMLPEMLVSAQIEGQGGVLELQKELASICNNTVDREQQL